MPFGFPILRKGSELPGFHLVHLSRPKVIVAAVFNASQIEGIPALEPVRDVGWDPVEKAEQLLAVSQAKIQHSQGSGAFLGTRRCDRSLAFGGPRVPEGRSAAPGKIL
jgi:hypothetical protein